MKKIGGVKTPCPDCSINGYSPELCRLHLKHLQDHPPKTKHGGQPQGWKCWGSVLTVGAGVGVGASVAGMAIAPIFAGKLLLGHVLGTKIAGCAGAIGAGSNLTLQAKNKKCTKSGNNSKDSARLSKLPRTLRIRTLEDEELAI